MEKETILTVEDDGILAVQLRNMLACLGCNVPEPAATGEAALYKHTLDAPNDLMNPAMVPGYVWR